MGVYDRQKASALRLIAKYGETVSYLSVGATVPKDPSKPWLPGGTSATTYTPKIAFIPIGGSVRRMARLMKNSDVETGTTLAYMPPVPFKPSLKDVITRKNGSAFRIVSIDPIEPNDEGALLYEMELVE